MRIRPLLAAAAALTLAACGDSSTRPELSPTKPTRELTCRSGYHIATREDGSESCEPDGDAYAAPTTEIPGTGTSPAPDVDAAPFPVPPAALPPGAVPPVTTPATTP